MQRTTGNAIYNMDNCSIEEVSHLNPVTLKDGERLDDLQCGGYRLIQNPKLYCFSTDSVLLSDFTRVPNGASVIDLGAGTGILTVLMHSRQHSALYKAVEIQPELYDLLRRNLSINGMLSCSQAVNGDLKDAPLFFGTHNDVCVSNPPFEKVNSGCAISDGVIEGARREILITFGEICEAASRCLRTGGRFFLVHRTNRLAELMSRLREKRLEPKELQLVASAPGKEPRTCLIMAQKDAAEGMRVLPQIILYNEDGTESAQMKKIYRREDR